MWQGDLSPWEVDWGHNMPQRWENLADKSCEAPGAGLGPTQELENCFLPSPAWGSRESVHLSAPLESPASGEAGVLQGACSLKGLRPRPQPHPRGPWPWGWPMPCLCSSTLNSELCGVVKRVRHIPSGQNPPGAMMPKSRSTECGSDCPLGLRGGPSM